MNGKTIREGTLKNGESQYVVKAGDKAEVFWSEPDNSPGNRSGGWSIETPDRKVVFDFLPLTGGWKKEAAKKEADALARKINSYANKLKESTVPVIDPVTIIEDCANDTHTFDDTRKGMGFGKDDPHLSEQYREAYFDLSNLKRLAQKTGISVEDLKKLSLGANSFGDDATKGLPKELFDEDGAYREWAFDIHELADEIKRRGR